MLYPDKLGALQTNGLQTADCNAAGVSGHAQTGARRRAGVEGVAERSSECAACWLQLAGI